MNTEHRYRHPPPQADSVVHGFFLCWQRTGALQEAQRLVTSLVLTFNSNTTSSKRRSKFAERLCVCVCVCFVPVCMFICLPMVVGASRRRCACTCAPHSTGWNFDRHCSPPDSCAANADTARGACWEGDGDIERTGVKPAPTQGDRVRVCMGE